MAIVTITADLNGGDQVTPNADLTYKIYNGSDALIGSKGSANTDTDVSVIGDIVTLINVDIGADTIIKITSTNQFGQEAVLSDPFTFVPPVNPFENASVVLSLRDIFGTNNAVARVRRSLDTTEQDFTATELTDGTLLAFVGAGNGFVSTWYDQKNSNNALNIISNEQPRIVSGGLLIENGGNPAINYTANVQRLAFDQVITGTSPRSIFIVNKPNSSFTSAGVNCLISLNDGAATTGGAYRICRELNDLRLRVFGGNSGFNYPTGESVTDYNILTNIWSSGGSQDAEFWSNGVVVPYSVDTSNNLNTEVGDGKHYIGWYDAASVTGVNHNIQEVIIFDTDQSANRIEIETDINNYYNIF